MYFSFRVKFSRIGPVKYMGHLDMLRYFQKVMLRSNLPIRYSEGFNPHQIMSFAYPLGVSMETEGDYFDMDLVFDDQFTFSDRNEEKDYCKHIMEAMNAVMGDGIAVESVSLVPPKELNAMAAVYAADYRILCKCRELISAESLRDYLSQARIMVQKESKKSGLVNEMDLKEGILSLSLKETELPDYIELFATLRSGSEMNVKAQTLVQSISDYCQSFLTIASLRRMELYRLSDGNIVPLGEFIPSPENRFKEENN